MVWRILFDKNSAGDIGTLYQAKNYLNAVNTPIEPMDNPDAAFDLLESYTDALVLTCYDEVSHKQASSGLALEQEKIKDDLLNSIVDGFAIPKMPHTPLQSGYMCQICKKKYKRVANYRNHIQKKHASDERNDMNTGSDEDGVYNYSCNALGLGLLAKNFVDARKHGDGERIIRLYKFLLLYFRLEHQTKYSYYILYTLCQVHQLLPPKLAHELVWNRTNNSRGLVDSNVENDRTVEHHNKYFKMDCKDFQGKVTSKSIARASQSYSNMNDLMGRYDNETATRKPSGKHTKPDNSGDIRDLCKQMKQRNI